jgi:hypothetical protein
MNQAIQTHQVSQTGPSREYALKLLSRSIYRDLRRNGYEPRQIVAVAAEIISQVTSDIKGDTDAVSVPGSASLLE